MDPVIILGRCKTGITCTMDGYDWSWFLTDCCAASAKGMEDGVGCRACYHLIPDALGGVYDERFDGPIGPLTDGDRMLLARSANVVLAPSA